MNKQLLYDNYITKGYNCAEALLRTANEDFCLNVPEESFKLVSGFGGGMGCGDICGALSSAISVIGALLVEGHAHATDGFSDKCAAFCQNFIEKEGSTKCGDIKEKNVEEDLRCFKTVEATYELLIKFLTEEGRIEADRSDQRETLTSEDIKRVKGLGFLHNKGTNRFNGRIITRNGKVTAAELSHAAQAAEKFGDGHIALTTRLTMEATGIPYDSIEEFCAFLAEGGLETGGTGAKVRPVVACKGTTCQYGLCDTFLVSDEIHEKFYKGFNDVKLPHKFKIAVGGCPNNCVKPDLNDFGIIGQQIPAYETDKCRGCAVCAIEKGCPINAAKVADGRLVILEDACNHCGRCVGQCPFGAIPTGNYGYKVVIGGRWGKKSAKGEALKKVFTTRQEVLAVLEKAILLFREQGKTGERFSDTISRIGFSEVERILLSDEILTRKQDIIESQVAPPTICT